MNIQPLLYTDIGQIKDLQPIGWADIFSSIEFYTKNGFCHPLKVIMEDKIIGMGTAIIHHDIAWLAHIIVHPDHRNKGIGRFITATLINSPQLKKCKSIQLIATDLGAPVYEKLGFITDTEYLFFQDIKKNEDYELSPYMLPYSPRYRDGIAALDKLISGEDRMFHLEQYFHDSYVYKKNDSIEGFYLPSFGNGYIAANTEAAGIELMKCRLSSKDHAVFPVDNTIASSFLFDLNYREVRTAKRMRLRDKLSWKPGSIYNRIGGNLG